MSIAGIVLLIVMGIIVAGIIALPILLPGRLSQTPAVPSALEVLNAEYQAMLITVRDLESDYQTGKLSLEDYTEQRKRQITHGAALLEQIEALQQG